MTRDEAEKFLNLVEQWRGDDVNAAIHYVYYDLYVDGYEVTSQAYLSILTAIHEELPGPPEDHFARFASIIGMTVDDFRRMWEAE